MTILEYFRRTKKSAAIARDRLQIIVSRESARGSRDYLPLLHQELVQVIAKYEQIDPEQVTVNLERNGDCDMLELNIVLHDSAAAQTDCAAVGTGMPRRRRSRSRRGEIAAATR